MGSRSRTPCPCMRSPLSHGSPVSTSPRPDDIMLFISGGNDHLILHADEDTTYFRVPCI
jgi:hypothetical protein